MKDIKMKFESAIKKLKKHNLELISNGGNFCHTIVGKYILEFHCQRDGEIASISTRRQTDMPDVMTDYFPNVWHDNLSKALKHLGIS